MFSNVFIEIMLCYIYDNKQFAVYDKILNQQLRMTEEQAGAELGQAQAPTRISWTFNWILKIGHNLK